MVSTQNIILKTVNTENRTYGPCNQYWISFSADVMVYRLECFCAEKDEEEFLIDQHDEITAYSISSVCKYLYSSEPGFERYVVQVFVIGQGEFNIQFKEKEAAEEFYIQLREWWHAHRKKSFE